ncbi:hypothetical protein A9Q81_15175 [Gammaproteobacteria bacterium 42_54_T18]|nr:hypothetical protein A9Q81_15175 [Gammaproteobacteria bacterium 42_54_T18]
MRNELPCILIVDDDQSNRKILYDLLKSYARIVLAKNATQAIEYARIQQPSLILLDVVMPDKDGFEILEQLKQDNETRNISVIFITARNSYSDETRGFRLGACDYIRKPFHHEIVKARVRTHLELAQKRHLLEELVNLDALTSIPNRRHLEHTLISNWRDAKRTQKPITIAMLDVDFFKNYNDHYGHAAGDDVLRHIASTIECQLNRPRDIVCRYGGEEFCFILPDTDINGAKRILEACCQAIEGLAIEHEKSQTSSVVTASIGACVCQPEEGDLHENALLIADQFLYKSKEAGRNCLSIHQE